MKTKQNMIDMFKGYSNYSEEEYNAVWRDSLIVVDANILLNFYRYSEDTREKLFAILKKMKKRLWIPYQVGKEFFENKNRVMVNSYKEYDILESELSKKLHEAKAEISKRKNDQLKCKSEIDNLLDRTLKKIQEALNKEKEKKKPNFNKDVIENNILELFNDSIGDQIINEEYIKMKEEGLRRIKEQIPPGYKDSTKNENGDYYIFYSLIKKSKAETRDVIFITDDVKEDWFNQLNGEKHGGRYELLNEFYMETGRLLLIYTSAGFAEAYNKNIEKDFADENTINELKSIRNFVNKKYYENNFTTKEYLNMIKRYKNNDGLFDKKLMLDTLRVLIMEMNIPFSNKEDLVRDLKMIRNDYYCKSDIEHDALENLINKITDYYNIDLDDQIKLFKEKCYQYLISIKSCKSSSELYNIYEQLCETISESLKFLSNFSRNELKLLHIELKKLLELLSNSPLINQDIIIEKLEYILGILYIY